MDGWVGHRNAYNQFLVALILICTQNNYNIFDECLEQCGRCAIQSEVHAMCVCVSIVKSVFVVSFELDTHTEDNNSDNDNDITSKVVPILFCWGIVYGIDLVHQST